MSRRFVFEIPSTCVEEVVVTAETLEEAIKILKNYDESKMKSSVPEVEWNSDTLMEGVLESLLAQTYEVEDE